MRSQVLSRFAWTIFAGILAASCTVTAQQSAGSPYPQAVTPPDPYASSTQSSYPAVAYPTTAPTSPQPDAQAISTSGLLPVYGLDFRFDPAWVDAHQFPSQSPAFPNAGVSESFQLVWGLAKQSGFSTLRLPLDITNASAAANQAANLCVWAKNNNLKLVLVLNSGSIGAGRSKAIDNSFPEQAAAFAKALISTLRSGPADSLAAYPQIMAFQLEDEANHSGNHGGMPGASAQQIVVRAAQQFRQSERSGLEGTGQEATPLMASASFDFELVKAGAAGTAALNDQQYNEAYKSLQQFLTGYTSAPDLDVIVVDWFPGTISSGSVDKLAGILTSLVTDAPGKSLLISTGYSTAFHSADEQKQYYSLAFANLADYRAAAGASSPFLGVIFHSALNGKDANVAAPSANIPATVASWDWNAKARDLQQLWQGKKVDDLSWWLKKTESNMGIFSVQGDASGTIAATSTPPPTQQALNQIATTVAQTSATYPTAATANPYGASYDATAAGQVSSSFTSPGSNPEKKPSPQASATAGLTGLLDAVFSRLGNSVASGGGAPGGRPGGRNSWGTSASNYSDCNPTAAPGRRSPRKGAGNNSPNSTITYGPDGQPQNTSGTTAQPNPGYDANGQPLPYGATSSYPTDSSNPAGQNPYASNNGATGGVTYGPDGQPLPATTAPNAYPTAGFSDSSAGQSSPPSGLYDPGYGPCNSGPGVQANNYSGNTMSVNPNAGYGMNVQPGNAGSGNYTNNNSMGANPNSGYGTNVQPGNPAPGNFANNNSTPGTTGPATGNGIDQLGNGSGQLGSFAKPSIALAAQDIKLQPAAPQVGQPVTITANVNNQDPTNAADLSVQAVDDKFEWLSQPVTLHVAAKSASIASLQWTPADARTSFPLTVRVSDAMGNDVTSASLAAVTVAAASGSVPAGSGAPAGNPYGDASAGSAASAASGATGSSVAGAGSHARVYLSSGNLEAKRILMGSGQPIAAGQVMSLVVPTSNHLGVPLHNVEAVLLVNNVPVANQTMSLVLPNQSRSIVFPSVRFPNSGQQEIKVVLRSQRPNAAPQTGYIVQQVFVHPGSNATQPSHSGVRSMAGGAAPPQASSSAPSVSSFNRPSGGVRSFGMRSNTSQVSAANTPPLPNHYAPTAPAASNSVAPSLNHSSPNPVSVGAPPTLNSNANSAPAALPSNGQPSSAGDPFLRVSANEIGFNATQARAGQETTLTFTAVVRNVGNSPAKEAKAMFKILDPRSGKVMAQSPVQTFQIAPHGAFQALWRISARPNGEALQVVVLVGPQQFTKQPFNQAAISVRVPEPAGNAHGQPLGRPH